MFLVTPPPPARSVRRCEWALCGCMQDGSALPIHTSPSRDLSVPTWLMAGANMDCWGDVGPAFKGIMSSQLLGPLYT